MTSSHRNPMLVRLFACALIVLFGATEAVAQANALKIVVIEGENAVNIIQQKTAVPPVVEVRDQNDLPVSGAIVTFSITGGKTTAFAGGAQSVSITTNAAGRAAVSALSPVSNGAVQIQVQAAFQGQTATTTISQMNFATAAEAAQAGSASSGSGGGTAATAAEAGGFPLKTVVLLGAAGGGGLVAYDLYQKYGPGSGSHCSSSFGGPGTVQNQIPAAGGTFAVTTTESCAFRVTTNSPWIALSVSSTQVFQPQTLAFTYTVAPNSGPARLGAISIEQEDRSGGSSFSVGQVAGTSATFRGTIASLPEVAFDTDGVCNYTLTFSGVVASLTRNQTGISQAHVSVLATRTPVPPCPVSPLPSDQQTYTLESGSIAEQNVRLRFRASRSNASVPTLLFNGTQSSDNRTITGTFMWTRADGAGVAVAAAMTFEASR